MARKTRQVVCPVFDDDNDDDDDDDADADDDVLMIGQERQDRWCVSCF